jgi:hypothetical protein
MGGSSSKSTTSSNTTNYSLQGVEGSGTVVQGSNNTVTTTDLGAIESAFEFGGSALAEVFSFGMEVLGINENLVDKSIGFTEEAMEQTFENSKETTEAIKELALASDGSIEALKNTTKTIYVLGGVVVLVLIFMMLMYRKR